ncbi:MAG TPA: hypothetical protein VIR27_15865 [Mycobacteriales bacterium]|jgi:DivIVA protein.
MRNTTVDFDVTMRGYDREQVEAHIARLDAELAASWQEREKMAQRIKALERRLEELHLESQAMQQSVEEPPTLAGLGARMEKILRLAEEEANSHREEARAEAQQHRAGVEQESAKLRESAEKFAKETRASAEAEAKKIVDQARSQAEQARLEADRDAASTREEAQAHFEAVRARAAQAAADFETNLARRREQAERDHKSRTEAAEQQLAEMIKRTEQLRLEAEKTRADADRRARQMIDSAQSEAEELVGEAKAKAERIRLEGERDLAALLQRREAINAQLKNVRAMLATLSGSPAIDLGDPEPLMAALGEATGKAASDTGTPGSGGGNAAKNTAARQGKDN